MFTLSISIRHEEKMSESGLIWEISSNMLKYQNNNISKAGGDIINHLIYLDIGNE